MVVSQKAEKLEGTLLFLFLVAATAGLLFSSARTWLLEFKDPRGRTRRNFKSSERQSKGSGK